LAEAGQAEEIGLDHEALGALLTEAREPGEGPLVVAYVLEDVPETGAIAVDEVGAIVARMQRVASAEHYLQEAARPPRKACPGGREAMPAHVER